VFGLHEPLVGHQGDPADAEDLCMISRLGQNAGTESDRGDIDGKGVVAAFTGCVVVTAGHDLVPPVRLVAEPILDREPRLGLHVFHRKFHFQRHPLCELCLHR
jgi:hypothetical protein